MYGSSLLTPKRNKHPADVPTVDIDKNERKLTEFTKTGKIFGKGSFGCVYEVTDNNNGRLYAAKMDLRHSDGWQDVIQNKQKILHEFNILQRIDHTHIIHLHCCIVDNETFHVVMELANCGSLDKYMAREIKYDMKQRKLLIIILKFHFNILNFNSVCRFKTALES